MSWRLLLPGNPLVSTGEQFSENEHDEREFGRAENRNDLVNVNLKQIYVIGHEICGRILKTMKDGLDPVESRC